MDFSLGYLKTRMGIPGPHFGFQLHRFGAGFPKGFHRQIMTVSGFNRSPSIEITIYSVSSRFLFFTVSGKLSACQLLLAIKKSKIRIDFFAISNLDNLLQQCNES